MLVAVAYNVVLSAYIGGKLHKIIVVGQHMRVVMQNTVFRRICRNFFIPFRRIIVKIITKTAGTCKLILKNRFAGAFTDDRYQIKRKQRCVSCVYLYTGTIYLEIKSKIITGADQKLFISALYCYCRRLMQISFCQLHFPAVVVCVVRYCFNIGYTIILIL